TTLNRQQYDVGTQYRSAIFYHSEVQKQAAERMIETLENKNVFNDPIVTEVTQATPFYEAEPEHKEYYTRNPEQRYCQAIIDPKIKKLRQLYSDKLKMQ